MNKSKRRALIDAVFCTIFRPGYGMDATEKGDDDGTLLFIID